MSTRRKIVIVAALLMVVVTGLLLSWRRRTEVSGQQAAATPPGATKVRNQEQSESAARTQESIPPTNKPSPGLKRTFETLNHNPIEFYGRALDQFGAPVPGAEVRGTVLVNTGTRGGEMKAITTTDAQGYFQFTKLKGQDLGILIVKDGYEYRPRNSSFSYTYFEADHKRHIPDPKSPVIFTLWKKQGAETLVHYDNVWRFPVNRGPVRINLVTGKMGEQEADLIVTISRTPLTMRYGERGFAWTAVVEAVGGGLIRAGERDYYNLAPESGYTPRFEFSQEAQSVSDAQEEKIKWSWRENVTDDLFLSSRNGKNYARVSLRIRPNSDRQEGDNEALIAAEVWLNPNGSRNLEFDSAKAIRPPQ